MGKLLLCSDLYRLNKVKENIIGFSESGKISGAFGHIITFSKIRFQTENIVSNEKGFVAGTGTFLYKGKTGSEALRALLQDFDGNLSIRANIVGSYCVIMGYAEKVYVFVDEASLYNIYYNLSPDRENIILTNTYYHVAKGMDNVCIEEDHLLGTWFIKLIDNSTPIQNVKKLMGHECLVFNDGQWCAEEIPVTVVDDCLSVPQKAQQLYQNLGHVFKSSGVFMTGGQDSRISLALMLSVGMKPTLYYGIGNSSNTSTKTEDFNIVNAFSKKFDLPIQIMNWKDSDQTDEANYINKYGEMFSLYGMNKNIFREFETEISSEFIALGYFGEVYRTIESIEAYAKPDFTLDEFLDDLYLGDCKRVFEEGGYQEFKAMIKDQFLDVCRRRELDAMHLTKDQFQILNTVYRQRWDTVMNNFVNQYMYSIPLFGNLQLTRKTEAISYDERLNSKHLMECIYALQPELLEIPFFSHIKVKKYNPVTHELTNKEYVSNIKDAVRGMIRSERMMKFARSVYYTLRGDKKGRQEIAEQYSQKETLQQEYSRTIDLKHVDAELLFRFSDVREINSVLLLYRMLNQLGAIEKE